MPTHSANTEILILVPTQIEKEELNRAATWLADVQESSCDEGSSCGQGQRIAIELCGFGPVAAAASTSRLLATYSPSCVVLVGIAGSYGAVPVGQACTFSSVSIEGVGANTSTAILRPSDLGIPQWIGEDEVGSNAKPERVPNQSSRIGDAVFERLPLAFLNTVRCEGEILTVCAASGSSEEAESRAQRFTDSVAEDMEAFGVALACRMANCPLVVVRGMSNDAGDRNLASWRISDAIKSASDLLRRVLETPKLLSQLG